jgi:initiation factor 1A
MKKNAGGNKAKKRARNYGPTTFRPAKEEGEMYASVLKKKGNGILEVQCIDGNKRDCKVRKKFYGSKEPLMAGTWVLVGLYSWETNSTKCDLLEIYSSSDMDRLQTMSGNWNVLLGITKPKEDDLIDFMDEIEVDKSAPVEIDMEVNFDDI